MNSKNMTQEEFEQIEAYLNNEMSLKDQEIFKKKIDQDSTEAEKVREVKLMIQAVEEDTFKNKMNALHATHFEQASKDNVVPLFSKKQSSFKLALVASIALLLGLGGYFYVSQSSSNEKLYAQFFQPDPGLITPMSATDNYDFYRGMVDYKQGKYQLAATRWENLLQENPKNDTLNFYLGIINLIQDKPNKAKSYLQQAQEEKNSIFQDNSWFYLGLIALKQDNIKEAILNLEKSNSPKAKELLEKIKS